MQMIDDFDGDGFVVRLGKTDHTTPPQNGLKPYDRYHLTFDMGTTSFHVELRPEEVIELIDLLQLAR